MRAVFLGFVFGGFGSAARFLALSRERGAVTTTPAAVPQLRAVGGHGRLRGSGSATAGTRGFGSGARNWGDYKPLVSTACQQCQCENPRHFMRRPHIDAHNVFDRRLWQARKRESECVRASERQRGRQIDGLTDREADADRARETVFLRRNINILW